MTISNSKNKIRVWDIPVRLFHWALVVLIVLQVVTAEAEGRGFALHIFFGYGILLLNFLWTRPPAKLFANIRAESIIPINNL